jgi:hypothetical protein
MIVTDKDKRLIIWGYKASPTQVSAPLLYIAPYFFRDDVELNNGIVVRIPCDYLGSTYPTAVNNIVLDKIV